MHRVSVFSRHPGCILWTACRHKPHSPGRRRLVNRYPAERHAMKVLAIDIGGTNVKILASGQTEPRKFQSGRELTPQRMISEVKALTQDWEYDVVAIGYPGRVHHGRPMAEPRNLAPGWKNFNFAGAFRRPVKIMNDAAMQALGSYKGGLMLFIGLGTGLGSAIIEENVVVPLELGQVPYSTGTFENYLGRAGLKRLGKKKWQVHVKHGVARLIAAFHPDDVVIGGGNIKKLKTLPAGCRAGHKLFAFLRGFRLWEEMLPATAYAAPTRKLEEVPRGKARKTPSRRSRAA